MTSSRDILLYCRQGYFVDVDRNGNIRGSPNRNTSNVLFDMMTIGDGEYTFQGRASKLFLAMSARGGLYAASRKSDSCVWKEKQTTTGYTMFQSKSFNWFLGIRKDGAPKLGHKARELKRATEFLITTPEMAHLVKTVDIPTPYSRQTNT